MPEAVPSGGEFPRGRWGNAVAWSWLGNGLEGIRALMGGARPLVSRLDCVLIVSVTSAPTLVTKIQKRFLTLNRYPLTISFLLAHET